MAFTLCYFILHLRMNYVTCLKFKAIKETKYLEIAMLQFYHLPIFSFAL